MPRRLDIEEFRPTGLRLSDDPPFYSDADLEEILKAAPPLPEGDVSHERVKEDGSGFEKVRVEPRVALADRLESAAQAYACEAEWQVSPTPNMRCAAYDRIERAASKLLNALGAPTGELDEVPIALRLGGSSPACEDLRAVARLRQWARDQTARMRDRESPPSHGGDQALNGFIVSMARIWCDIFGRSPGRSVSEHRRGGPLPQLVRAALTPLLGENNLPTDAQIADRIKDLKDMGKLPD